MSISSIGAGAALPQAVPARHLSAPVAPAKAGPAPQPSAPAKTVAVGAKAAAPAPHRSQPSRIDITA